MNQREEVWKSIPGFADYEVSNYGNIKSLKRNSGKLLKPWLRGSREDNKYLVVELNGKICSIHRLVAEAFIPNPNNLPQVNHKNGIKTCNEDWNLEWTDNSGNQKHAIETGLKKYNKGSGHKNCRLSKIDVRYIKENFIYGDSEFGARALGKKFNVDKSTIMKIIKGETYRDVKFKYTIYAVSDIHGGYDYLIQALNKAGFNPNKYNHLLISLGDEFDRLNQSLSVYQYLRSLWEKGKAIILKGNHSMFMIDYLSGENLSPFNYFHNGTRETLADFLSQTAPFETWCALKHIDEPTYGDFAEWISIAKKEINEDYPELLAWLITRPYYYETENYIFTHGAIDGTCEDWHFPKKDYKGRFMDWDACMWDDGSFFNSDITNTDKTVVVGHFGTYHLRKMYYLKSEDPHSILKREDGRVIAIDATTALSHKVNVLVIEDNLLEE